MIKGIEKRIVWIIILCVTICSLFSCNYHETDPSDTLRYYTQTPATAAEYNIMINSKITPIINIVEGLMTRSLHLNRDESMIVQELSTLESNIDYLNEIYESCKMIMPPDSEKTRHAATLTQMQRIVSSISHYKDILVESQENDSRDIDLENMIKDSREEIGNELIALKDMFNLVA